MSKTQNVFALLNFLQAHKAATTKQMAAALNVTPRSVHRYIRELRQAGYVFKTKGGLHGYTDLVGGQKTGKEKNNEND
jgi:predicted DNA-binding transcriptional regulator YafY